VPLSLLLAKIVVSAGLVVVVTALAERFGPRVGGIAASVPQLAVVSLIFFGLDQGLEFAAESAFWNIAGICATIPFVIGYVAGATFAYRSRVTSIAAGALTATALFALASVIIGGLTPPRLVVVPLAAALCAGTAWLFRRLPDTAPMRPVRVSPSLLAVRAGLASVSVILFTSLAHALGPKWSGVLTGYPVNTLPVIAVLHFHYGLDVARAALKVWPLGAFGICVFNLVAWMTVARLGLIASVPLGYIADFIYLLTLDAIRRAWLRRPVVQS
jgi:hypothetical protein